MTGQLSGTNPVLCKVMKQQNARFQRPIDVAGSVTPEIQTFLDEREKMGKTCEAESNGFFSGRPGVGRRARGCHGHRLRLLQRAAYCRARPRVLAFPHGMAQALWNFNVIGEVRAARNVFHSDMPFVIFDTGTHLTCPLEESARLRD